MKRLTAAALAATLALAACSGEEKSDPIEIGTDGPISESGSTDEPADADAIIVVGSSPESLTADQQSALDGYIAYWNVRADAYRSAEIDSAALGKVATGQAATTVSTYVSEQQARGSHTEGQTTLNVSEVVVDADNAIITDCLDDDSADVDDTSGEPIEQPAGDLGVQASLTRNADGWIVTDLRTSVGC